MMDTADVDLTNPEHIAELDLFPYYQHLRKHEPIKRAVDQNGRPCWVVLRYRDILTIYRNPLLYSSEGPIVITGNPVFEEAGKGEIIIQTDPPRHAKLRGLVKFDFTPMAMAKLEPTFRELAKRLVNAALERGECDLVHEIAARMPMQVFCKMMGIPESEWDLMNHLVEYNLLGVADNEFRKPEQLSQLNTAGNHGDDSFADRALEAYFDAMVTDRRNKPQSDLVSRFATASLEGVPLSHSRAVRNSMLLLSAGLETTRNAISGGVYTLLRHPDQLQRLIKDPSLMKTAIEEILRYVSPVVHQLRLVTADTELSGYPLKKGELVANWIVSANRDEEVFENPERFDIGRTPNLHLAFGYGEHFCLGSNLARTEIKVVLQELLPHLPSMTVTAPIRRVRNCCLPGIKDMRVKFDRTPGVSAP
jgi:cytochrome P450